MPHYGGSSRTVVCLSAFLNAEVYYFLRLLEPIKDPESIEAEVEHLLESGQGARINKRLKNFEVVLNQEIGVFLKIQPDNLILSILPIVGTDGQLMDPK